MRSGRQYRKQRKRGEERGGSDARHRKWDLRRGGASEPYDWNIGHEHAGRGAGDDRGQILELRRECDGGDLRLVAHLGQEKRNGGDRKYAEMAALFVAPFVELIGSERPQ